MAKYRVLSIDGGGIRGIVTTVMMQRLAAAPGLEGFLDKVDLIAGTSTGGLLALGIARGLSLEEMRNIYVDDGPEIFDDSWIDDLLDLGKLRGADYKTAPMRRVLKRVLGEADDPRSAREEGPGDDLRPRQRAPEEEKADLEAEALPQLPGAGERPLRVGLTTSASTPPRRRPTSPRSTVTSTVAFTPTTLPMCALAQTQDERYIDPPVDLKDVVLLSLGTGTSLFHIKGKNLNWGYAQWIKPLISLMLDGISGIADYQCSQMLRDRYHRLAPVFPPDVSISMDEVKKIPYMIGFADGLKISKTVDWMRENWMTD